MADEQVIDGSEATETPVETPVVPEVTEPVVVTPKTRKGESKMAESKVTTHEGYICVMNIQHDGVIYAEGTEFPVTICSEESLKQLIDTGALKIATFKEEI